MPKRKQRQSQRTQCCLGGFVLFFIYAFCGLAFRSYKSSALLVEVSYSVARYDSVIKIIKRNVFLWSVIQTFFFVLSLLRLTVRGL